MSRFVPINSDIKNMIKDASSLKTGFITVSLRGGQFIVAVDGVTGMISLKPVETEHPDFTIQIDTKIALELMRIGNAVFDVRPDNSMVKYSLYLLGEEEGEPFIESTFIYSTSPAIDSLLDKIVFSNAEPIKIEKSLFNSNLLELIHAASGVLTVKGKIAYSRDTRLAVYYFIQEEVSEQLVLDTVSYKFIMDNIEPESQFYKVDKNFIMQTEDKFITWRAPYSNDSDTNVEEFFKKKPFAECKISVNPYTPLINFKAEKGKEEYPCVFDFNESSVLVRNSYATVKSRFSYVGDFESTRINKISVIQPMAKYFTLRKVMELQVFKRFVRLKWSNCILDIGGEIEVETIK